MSQGCRLRPVLVVLREGRCARPGPDPGVNPDPRMFVRDLTSPCPAFQVVIVYHTCIYRALTLTSIISTSAMLGPHETRYIVHNTILSEEVYTAVTWCAI